MSNQHKSDNEIASVELDGMSCTIDFVYPDRPLERIWWILIDPSGFTNGQLYHTEASAKLHLGPHKKAIQVCVDPYPQQP